MTRKDGILYCEEVSLLDLAQTCGTPAYVYSAAVIEKSYQNFAKALSDFDALICYAVKANGNINILKRLVDLGAGFDIVSLGELTRVLRAGGNPKKVIFSGVGKTREEIAQALDHGILAFHIESLAELQTIEAVAKEKNTKAAVSARLNPEIDAKTHPYIATALKESKFGLLEEEALACYGLARQSPYLHPLGLAVHIGSQIGDSAPFEAAIDKMLAFVDKLAQAGIVLSYIDLGGGYGIRYEAHQAPFAPEQFFPRLAEKFWQKNLKLLIEPGRSIIGAAGLLLTQVIYVKPRQHTQFAIVDAGMNDLMRPALYSAYHAIEVVRENKCQAQPCTIVGPICESSDVLGKDRMLALAEGDYLAIMAAGAYGMSMASNYNTRPRPMEVLVDGQTWTMIRRRESLEEILAPEIL